MEDISVRALSELDEITSSTEPSTLSYGQVIQRHSISAPLAILDDATPEIKPQRTIDDVRQQAASSLALRAIRKAETVDGSQVGVIFTLSHTSDERFLKLVASSLKHALRTRSYLFAVASPSAVPEDASPLLFCGSSDEAVQRSGLLISSKFIGRVTVAESFFSLGLWVGAIRGLCSSSFDHAALLDVVRKASRKLMDPFVRPPGSRSIAQILSDARARLERVTPREAYEELLDNASPFPVVLVDIRPEAQRRASGGIHGSLIVERNVLEWRFDPRSPDRTPVADRYDLRIIVFCQEGYTSSLAAASLQDLGMLNATDMMGGYSAWQEAGLPAEVVPAVVGSESSASLSDDH